MIHVSSLLDDSTRMSVTKSISSSIFSWFGSIVITTDFAGVTDTDVVEVADTDVVEIS